MAAVAFEELVEDFAFLDDWEDRYALVIELGKEMAPLDSALKVPATKVDGCASQVWIHATVNAGTFSFEGDSDAVIVRGLVAVLRRLYNGLDVEEVANVDAQHELGRLGLQEHLSSQRSNGVRSMIEKIKFVASET